MPSLLFRSNRADRGVVVLPGRRHHRTAHRRSARPTRTSADMRVPTGKYHSVATATSASATALPDARNANATVDASHARPKATKAAFMKLDRGAIPTALTTRLHGPSWPAKRPDVGVT